MLGPLRKVAFELTVPRTPGISVIVGTAVSVTGEATSVADGIGVMLGIGVSLGSRVAVKRMVVVIIGASVFVGMTIICVGIVSVEFRWILQPDSSTPAAIHRLRARKYFCN